MFGPRGLATAIALVTVTATPAAGQDLSKYRDFRLGSILAEVRLVVLSKRTAKKAAAGPRIDARDLTLVTHAEAVRFDKHVGHQVEVIGTLEQAAVMGTGGTMGAPATTAASGATGADATPQGTMGTSTLNVDVLRIISKSCR